MLECLYCHEALIYLNCNQLDYILSMAQAAYNDVIDHKVLVQEDKMLNTEATISFSKKWRCAEKSLRREKTS
jgi:hypothetical protein